MLGLAVAASGCSRLFPDYEVKHATNPAFREQQVASVWFAPTIDCTRRAERDERLRTWLIDTLFPTIVQAAGGSPTPLKAASESKTCRVLFDDFLVGAAGWNDVLQAKIAATLLEGQSEDYVFVLLFAVNRSCDERKVGLQDRNGVNVGSVGTGKFDCYEQSTFQLVGHLMKRTGERVYTAWLPLWVEQQERNYTPQMAAKITRELLVGYPSAQATASR